jgi:hypothetical protein
MFGNLEHIPQQDQFAEFVRKCMAFAFGVDNTSQSFAVFT